MTGEPRALPTVSVVLETDSVHAFDTITFADCLAALEGQDYPRDRLEVVVVDGGKVPGVGDLVRKSFDAVVVVEGAAGSKFEQKNLGVRAARGDVVAFVDADCAPPAGWLRHGVDALQNSPPDVAGVQGLTSLAPGLFSRELTALFYGIRRVGDGEAARLVTDNCLFRTAVLRRFAFEPAWFSTVVDSLLLRRLRRAGYRVRLTPDLGMVHSFPGALPVTIGWFFARGWAVGYYMLRARQLEPGLPGGALVRWGGLGWPLLVLAKAGRDWLQVWDHRRRAGGSLLVALPLILLYETTILLGGVGALCRLRPPRVS
jgi:glycosyltransferase involved in cell wall biosynthesis